MYMDLNYLLFRHQVSLMRANAAQCSCSRRSHHGLAAGYAARIRVLQGALGVDAMLRETRL